MADLVTGMIAGLAATLLLSMMMLVKKALGLLPRLDMIGMLARVTDQPRPIDWLLHFAVGIFFYGILMAGLAGMLPLDHWLTGVVAGAIGWMIASLTFMPAAGKGLFGLKIGPAAVIMSMMMHLMFGAALGLVYGWLLS